MRRSPSTCRASSSMGAAMILPPRCSGSAIRRRRASIRVTWRIWMSGFRGRSRTGGFAGGEGEPEERRIERWRDKLAPWAERVRDFRNEGFYERFAAKGQIERVAKIHRELARAAGIPGRAAERKAA